MAINHWEPGAAAYWSGDGSWSLGHKPLATEDVTFDGSDTSDCEVDENSVALSVTISDGYTGLFEVKTTVTLDIGGSLTSDGTFRIINYGTIQGCVNFGGATLTGDSWEDEGTITVDQDGTLDLGYSTLNRQAVTVTATAVTLGGSFKCKSFELDATGGTLTGAAKTITVGAGGLSYVAGALDAAGTLNITIAETCAGQWDTGDSIGLLTVNTDQTLTVGPTNDLRCEAVAGAGNIIIPSSSRRIWIGSPAANFWTHTGTVTTTGTGYLFITLNANRTNAANIDTGANTKTRISCPDKTLTASGTFDIGSGALEVSGSTGTTWAGLSVGGDFTCGALQLGSDTSDRPGRLTLTAGTTNLISGAVDAGDAVSAAPSQLNLAGQVTFGGTVLLARTAPNFGSAYISGAVTINGANSGTVANTRGIIAQATVTNLAAPAANKIYVYRHDHLRKLVKDSRLPREPSRNLSGHIGAGCSGMEYAFITRGGSWGRNRGRKTTTVGESRRKLARN